MPNVLSALIFCNGMTRKQRRFTLSRIHPEAATMITEPVYRRDLPDDVPRTGILTLRDHALFRRIQLRSIAALGGVQTLIPVDTCHDLMISEPAVLAEILHRALPAAFPRPASAEVRNHLCHCGFACGITFRACRTYWLSFEHAF